MWALSAACRVSVSYGTCRVSCPGLGQVCGCVLSCMLVDVPCALLPKGQESDTYVSF